MRKQLGNDGQQSSVWVRRPAAGPRHAAHSGLCARAERQEMPAVPVGHSRVGCQTTDFSFTTKGEFFFEGMGNGETLELLGFAALENDQYYRLLAIISFGWPICRHKMD